MGEPAVLGEVTEEQFDRAFWLNELRDRKIRVNVLTPARSPPPNRKNCSTSNQGRIRVPHPPRKEMQGSPRASRRHAALGTAHQGRETITGCPRPMSLT